MPTEAEYQSAFDLAERHMNEKHVLRRNFARYLAPFYVQDRIEIARLCDEELDRSGALLGYVREEAAKLSS